VPEPDTYDYAVIRVVPRVERELDEARLIALHPGIDLEAVRAHLRSIAAICAGGEGSGPIGLLSRKERFRWLTSPRSTIIQTSAAHTGTCGDPPALVQRLLDQMVRFPKP
jgi:hypothetical protein